MILTAPSAAVVASSPPALVAASVVIRIASSPHPLVTVRLMTFATVTSPLRSVPLITMMMRTLLMAAMNCTIRLCCSTASQRRQPLWMNCGSHAVSLLLRLLLLLSLSQPLPLLVGHRTHREKQRQERRRRRRQTRFHTKRIPRCHT
jgi:hypothetical protein